MCITRTAYATPDGNDFFVEIKSWDAFDPPEFSHEGGFYDSAFGLILSHPDTSALIFFTTDGSVPTVESTLYSSPIELRDRSNEPNLISMIPTNRITEGGRVWREPAGSIRKGSVIRAIAVVDGVASEEVSHSYFIFDEGDDAYPLPVVSIITDNDHLFDDETGIYVPGIYYEEGDGWSGNYYQRGEEWERPASFEFFEADGSLALKQNIGIRIHGGWTRRLPMKSLRLYARSDYGESRFNYRMFENLEDNRFNRFILRNSGNDFGNTMFMDAAAQSLIRHFNVDTQEYRPVIVFLNGEYWGIHNVRERYDRRYLERVYGADPDNIDLLTGSQTVKEGDYENYEQLLSFIRATDFSDDENYAELQTKIDIDNFLDYYSAQIYYGNTDWPQNNIDFWRSRVEYNPNAPVGLDGRWRWLLYDVDRSLGLITDASFDMIEWVTVERNLANNRTYPNLLLRSFLHNETFYTDFINRIADHLNTAFLPERVSQVIDSLKTPLNPVIEEHIDRWQNHLSRGHWENRVRDMHEYAAERPGYLRFHIRQHFDVGDETEITINVSDHQAGYIRVNTTDIVPSTPGVNVSAYPWSGTYFSEVPVVLKAIPHSGFEFTHWSTADGDSIPSDGTRLRVKLNEMSAFTAHFTDDGTEPEKEVIHYWVFTEDLPNNAPLKFVEPIYSRTDGAYIKYNPAIDNYSPFSDTPGIMDRVNDPVNINYFPSLNSGKRYDESGMRGLRVRNPSLVNNRESSVIFNLPSTDHKDLEFTLATVKTGNGQPEIRFEYSTDSDNNFWRSEGLSQSRAILYEEYKQVNLSLGNITEANNNPYLKIRILFDGDENILRGSDGNFRFNNVSLTGNSGDFTTHEEKDDLLAYWLFTDEIPAESAIDTLAPVIRVLEDARLIFSSVHDGTAIDELGIPDRVDDPTALNYFSHLVDDIRFADAAITGIRARNPVLTDNNERALLLKIPSAGQQNLHVSFAAKRTPNGPETLIIETNLSPHTDDWTTAGLEKSEFPLFETYSLYTIDLSGVEGSENNPDFRLRIRFGGVEEYRNSSSGNVRFNNFLIRGEEMHIDVPEPEEPGPEIVLHQNYPNPYNSFTSISYEIPEELPVKLEVFDILGKRVALLEDSVQQAGIYSVTLNSSSLSSGIYIYRLVAGNTILQRKMTLIK
ncbi:MAG: T9SS C-terminal target domain-containing protein [Balneolaceae bacterium]|nr:MAG: T9SS C-terminal target domain-containing protein [Balneolaceae bacterium]